MNTVLLTADHVIIGPADQVIIDGAVLVDAGVVTAVGTASDMEATVSANVPRLRCPGATVMPGLIDCHVHLAFDAGPDPVGTMARTSSEDLALAMAAHAQQLLRAGVTTVRDLGDRDALTVALRTAIDAGATLGPRILAATTPLTSVGGHCGFLGGEVDSELAIRMQIARNKEAGADLIKVMASGGALTPTGPRMWEGQFDANQLNLIVSEAARHGLGVAAHAHGTDTIAACVAAGVRTLEHCSWRTPDGFFHDRETTRRIVKQDIAVCRCVSGDWRLFLEQLGSERAEAMGRIIREMRDAGVRFIAGTDAGVPGARFGDYAGMLEFFAGLGFKSAELLDMATTHSAHALGLTNTGNLTPGMRADLIVVEGNPLVNLEALRHVRHVYTAGVRA
ncbi:amidohydrolase family protein [Streptomyces goshikiensis]|uniref:amidohydrolase family protein n=1 Tax=Streptomyces goshikiensis TaxID=1942 RepID=UPI003676CEF4